MMINPNRATRYARQYRASDKMKTEDAADPVERRGENSLAMVYPVKQKFENLYDPDEALCAGTLFKELELPFHKGFRI